MFSNRKIKQATQSPKEKNPKRKLGHYTFFGIVILLAYMLSPQIAEGAACTPGTDWTNCTWTVDKPLEGRLVAVDFGSGTTDPNDAFTFTSPTGEWEFKINSGINTSAGRNNGTDSTPWFEGAELTHLKPSGADTITVDPFIMSAAPPNDIFHTFVTGAFGHEAAHGSDQDSLIQLFFGKRDGGGWTFRANVVHCTGAVAPSSSGEQGLAGGSQEGEEFTCPVPEEAPEIPTGTTALILGILGVGAYSLRRKFATS